jgi:hypothetical protein
MVFGRDNHLVGAVVDGSEGGGRAAAGRPQRQRAGPHETDKLPVVLSFMAEAAVSFHTNVELVDSEGHTYTIVVVGATDNSVLTSFRFLQHYADNYGYYAHDGKPVHFLGQQRIAAFERHELREKEKAATRCLPQRAIEGGKKAPPPPPPPGEPSLREELTKVTDGSVDMGAPPNAEDHRVPDFLRGESTATWWRTPWRPPRRTSSAPTAGSPSTPCAARSAPGACRRAARRSRRPGAGASSWGSTTPCCSSPRSAARC